MPSIDFVQLVSVLVVRKRPIAYMYTCIVYTTHNIDHISIYLYLYRYTVQGDDDNRQFPLSITMPPIFIGPNFNGWFFDNKFNQIIKIRLKACIHKPVFNIFDRCLEYCSLFFFYRTLFRCPAYLWHAWIPNEFTA